MLLGFRYLTLRLYGRIAVRFKASYKRKLNTPMLHNSDNSDNVIFFE